MTYTTLTPLTPIETVPPHPRAQSDTPRAAIDAALSPPAAHSTERDRQLLDVALESGPGGQALSVLERIDVANLSAHDRIRYLKAVTASAAWLEAFQSMSVAAVCGPSGGWVTDEIEARVSRDVADLTNLDSTTREREHLANQVRDEAWEVRERAITLEVSMAMRVSPRTAGRRIEGARFLLESLRPAVEEAIAGRWGYGHLRVAEKELANVPAPLREQVFADVLPYAATDHPRRLTDRIRKSLARRDSAGSAIRMRERAARRDVSLWNLPDGQARVVLTGPYQDVTRFHRQLTELARARQQLLKAASREAGGAQVDGESGGAQIGGAQVSREAGGAQVGGAPIGGEDHRLDALRFDAALEAADRLIKDMLAGAGSQSVIHSPAQTPSGNSAEQGFVPDPWTGPRATTPGSRPSQQAAIIVDLATALSLADEPGFLPGYGWVPAPIAREILADCDRWRRWLVDDKARKLIEAGSMRYRPSQALRDLVTGRDLTCTADTCTRPAAESQLDHAMDFDGANTTPANMHGVCGPDHLVITAGHFVIDTDDEGGVTWVSTSTGHSYPSQPDLLHERPVAREQS